MGHDPWEGLCDKCQTSTCCINFLTPLITPKELESVKQISGFSDVAESRTINGVPVHFLKTKPNTHECMFLGSDKKCTIYEDRPFECRIFPFDIYNIDGNLTWVVYTCNPDLEGNEYGKQENVFLSVMNEKIGQNFQRIFGKNQRIEFQTAQLKKDPSSQNTSLDLSETIRGVNSADLPTLEISHEQRGFTTETSGHISGSIITVVPDEFIEMIESFSGDAVGIDGSDDLMEFFNIINATVLSAIGNFFHVQIKSNPIRPYDSQKDKMVNKTDLMEINYTFELGDRNTWFTIYLWMNLFSSFEKKSDSVFSKI